MFSQNSALPLLSPVVFLNFLPLIFLSFVRLLNLPLSPFHQSLYHFQVYISLQELPFSHLFSFSRWSTIRLSLCIISFTYYNFYYNFEIYGVSDALIVKETEAGGPPSCVSSIPNLGRSSALRLSARLTLPLSSLQVSPGVKYLPEKS